MKAFEGFKSESSGNGAYEQLPAGPYVAKITNVKIDGVEPDQSLVLRLEVLEGEYKDYFSKRYQHDKDNGGMYEAKYKGDYRLRIPNPANTKSKYPDSDKRRFNDAIWRIERSNEGYHWDWNEKGLIGKVVGMSMQDDEYNGNQFTRIGRLEVAQDVRNGIVGIMKPRKRQETTTEAVGFTSSGFTAVENVEVPF